MALDGRDYTKRDKNGNIDYSKNVRSKDLDEFVNESYKAALSDEESNAKYCEYCGKKLETSYEKEKVMRTRIENGVVSSYFVNEVVMKYKSEQCSRCGKEFCHECMDLVRETNYDAALNRLCPDCSKTYSEECKQESLDQLKVKFEDTYECNHVYENRGLKEYSTNCKTYEETCIYCGHKNQVFESSTPINHNSHQKYCNNCGDEIKNGQKIESVMKTGITNGVVSKRSRKDIVNTTSACSNCDEDFCNSCLTYQRDKYSHENLYLCSSCLREYKKTLAEKQNVQSKKESFSTQNAFGTKRESTESRKKIQGFL